MNTRTSKLIFPAILFLFACLIAFGENGPTPKVVVGSSGISDGSVTPAKISSGYNLLTDAEKAQALSQIYFVASETFVRVGQVSLDDDESVDINTLLEGTAATSGRLEIYYAGNDGFVDAYLQGGANDVVLISNRYGAKTDSDGSLCVFSAGGGAYTLKNRFGAAATFLYIYKGRK